jgi:hypothetical protein
VREVIETVSRVIQKIATRSATRAGDPSQVVADPSAQSQLAGPQPKMTLRDRSTAMPGSGGQLVISAVRPSSAITRKLHNCYRGVQMASGLNR